MRRARCGELATAASLIIRASVSCATCKSDQGSPTKGKNKNEFHTRPLPLPGCAAAWRGAESGETREEGARRGPERTLIGNWLFIGRMSISNALNPPITPYSRPELP
eukprot:scaffold3725_cov129-Isochrysis_galbana.AAC.2